MNQPKEIAMTYATGHIKKDNPLADLPAYRSVPAKCSFRDITILRGIIFEVNHPGMRLTAKAPKCSTIIRREIGLKGKPESLARQLFALMEQHGMIECTWADEHFNGFKEDN